LAVAKADHSKTGALEQAVRLATGQTGLPWELGNERAHQGHIAKPTARQLAQVAANEQERQLKFVASFKGRFAGATVCPLDGH
jgi:hypothetical protein